MDEHGVHVDPTKRQRKMCCHEHREGRVGSWLDIQVIHDWLDLTNLIDI
jgi:hypothetical protein